MPGGTAKECRFRLHSPVYVMSSGLANRGRSRDTARREVGVSRDEGSGRETPGNHAVRMSFLLTNSSAASRPISREVPLRLTPPNGSSGESARTTLT